jgi:glyoxylase-like metal-dependent hydrolase (beta-lactamase superfamily II)/predicted DCC family thiol-disulfide oxidoreductase YuxK
MQQAGPTARRAGALFQVVYDEQCEICQAFMSWLVLLDRKRLTEPVPIEPDRLARVHPTLDLERCLRELHVVDAEGRIWTGWDAAARLARLFPATWPIGAAGAVPPFSWLARAAYRLLAANRYALSKCRGGACRVARPAAVRRKSPLAAFWSCYTLGLVLRLPLVIASGIKGLAVNAARFARTRGRRILLLGGKLQLLFLGGIPTAVVPLLFGEGFWSVLYDGVAVDPGSPRMRRALRRHLRRMPGVIRTVVATHQHEEHVGNLNWLSRRLGVPLFVPKETARILQPPARLPFARALIIGQPPPLEPPYEVLGASLRTTGGELEVFAAPGHCDDHVVLYDRREKLMLAGDAFMGAYFSAPNPDVDHCAWIATLERLLELDVEILIEGHGLLYTLRRDIPDIPGVVVRKNPMDEMRKKLDYLRWLREQIEAGRREGLPLRAVEATCFPWNRRNAWESFLNDEMMRFMSLGHWSRTELVRSFVRGAASAGVFPTVYEARFHCATSSAPQSSVEASGPTPATPSSVLSQRSKP